MEKIKSILFVDDDLDDREIFNEALSSIDASIHIEFAVNGLDALNKLKSGNTPDVIFSDINMPLMNGIQMLEEIKKSVNLSIIPVIIYTTSSNQYNQSQSNSLGAKHYIIKPTSFEKICAEIRFALEKIKNLHSQSGISFKKRLSRINHFRQSS